MAMTDPQSNAFLTSVGLHSLLKVHSSSPNTDGSVQEFITNFDPHSKETSFMVMDNHDSSRGCKRKRVTVTLDEALVGQAMGMSTLGLVKLTDAELPDLDPLEFFHPGAYKPNFGFKNCMAREPWLADALTIIGEVGNMRVRPGVTSPSLLWHLQMARRGELINWPFLLARNACKLLEKLKQRTSAAGETIVFKAAPLVSYWINYAAKQQQSRPQMEVLLPMPSDGISSANTQQMPLQGICDESLQMEVRSMEDEQIPQEQAQEHHHAPEEKFETPQRVDTRSMQPVEAYHDDLEGALVSIASHWKVRNAAMMEELKKETEMYKQEREMYKQETEKYKKQYENRKQENDFLREAHKKALVSEKQEKQALLEKISDLTSEVQKHKQKLDGLLALMMK